MFYGTEHAYTHTLRVQQSWVLCFGVTFAFVFWLKGKKAALPHLLLEGELQNQNHPQSCIFNNITQG